MDLALSLPGSLQTALFVEMLGEVGPLLALRLVSKAHKLTADRLLARLTRELKLQEEYWPGEVRKLENTLKGGLMRAEYNALWGRLTGGEQGEDNEDWEVMEVGLKVAGIAGERTSRDDCRYMLRYDSLRPALASVSLFRLTETQESLVSRLPPSLSVQSPPLSQSVHQFLVAVQRLLASPHFSVLKRRFAECVRNSATVRRCVRVLVRLQMMKTGQFFPRASLNVFVSKAEDEARKVYAEMRNLHC